ncbi:MAG TPA: S9 family peptidase [Nitriliruptorales bacterium]
MGLPELISRDLLLGDPERLNPKLSPDGTRLAYLAPAGGVMNLWVADLTPEGVVNERPVTRETERGIGVAGAVAGQALWAHNGRHLLYLQDDHGDENWRLYAIDLETDEIVDLLPFDGVAVQVLGTSPDLPDQLVVGVNARDARWHDAYLVDLSDGAVDLLYENPGFVGLTTDTKLQVRAATEMRPDGGIEIHVRETPDDAWRVLLSATMEDAKATQVVSFTRDGQGLVVVSPYEADTARLLRLDLVSGRQEILVEDEQYDVTSALLDHDTREPMAAAVVRAKPELVVLDDRIRGDIERLGQLLEGQLAFVSRDHADRRWIVSDIRSDAPGSYHLYDRDTRELTLLFHSRPGLDGAPLAPSEPFSFAARDGLAIHGYLTYPVGVPREQLPTVFYVHGGPWARDVWMFNFVIQLLANRGYLVVQVNYRGSSGYGKAFLNAGNKEWAGKMHDDLMDARQHLIDHGWADPDRIAITGGSYGGYAALVGATFTPEAFACAAEICGPSNLLTLLRSFPAYWTPMLKFWHDRVGDPDTEEEFLWERSPLSRVDDIARPLLVIQTENDPRVTQGEAEQIVAALQEKGIDHEYVLIPGEGHGFSTVESRTAVYAPIERFLAKHLGGRSED